MAKFTVEALGKIFGEGADVQECEALRARLAELARFKVQTYASPTSIGVAVVASGLSRSAAIQLAEDLRLDWAFDSFADEPKAEAVPAVPADAPADAPA